MRFTRASVNWWLLGGGIALLLWIGIQQYCWIERASEAERQERRQFLRNALGGVRNDMIERLRKPLAALRSDPGFAPGSDYAEILKTRFDQWRQSGIDSALIGRMTIGWINEQGKIECCRMEPADKVCSSCEWPPALNTYRTILDQTMLQAEGGPPFFPGGNMWSYSSSRLVLIFPIVEMSQLPPALSNRGINLSAKVPPGLNDASSPPPRPAPPRLRGWCFLEIDPEFLKQLAHELVLHYFGEVGINSYNIALISDEPYETIYQSAPGGPGWQRGDKGDEALPLFMPPRPERNPGPPGEARYGRSDPPPADDGAGRSFADAPRWRLAARHKSGSLDAAITRNRRQSLALSSGVLLLLLGSGVLLVLSTHRARSLARRQIEFVAGVSHELRTPLTVIQTTSYNLAQGKVSDARRVQQYGEAIQKEARRLTTQVEQILSFAGIESGRRLYDLRPVSVADIIARALAEYGPAFEAEGWQIERQVEAGLPPALADAQVLEGALKNLLQNALKYAGNGRWLGISAKAVRQRDHSEVLITVADHGPGIESEDMPHIFEPFYRGCNQTAGSATPGVGLGLSLVQRHVRAMGGRVTVKTAAGHGAAFTLHLPSTEPG